MLETGWGHSTQALLAVAAAAAVSLAAWRFKALTGTGAVAATLVGGTVLFFAGLGAAFVLVLFFVTSSALSAVPPGSERGARGARQVLANGSVAAVAAAFVSVYAPASVAFLGAIAAAAADTWATEIGVRLGGSPRSILTMRPQPPGTSGAVSLPGTGAAAAGSLAVGLAGVWLVPGAAASWVTVAAAGFLGSLVDSVLGAALQAEYRCTACGATPQVARHPDCPMRAARTSGVPGLDNDAVNWLMTASAAGAALFLQGLFGGTGSP